MTEGTQWQTRAAKWFCVALLIGIGYWALKYGAGIVIPFGIAYLVGEGVYPLSVAVAKRTRLPQRLCAALLLLLLLGGVGCALFFGVQRLLFEGRELLDQWQGGEIGTLSEVAAIKERVWSWIEKRLPVTWEGAQTIRGALDRTWKNLAESLEGKITGGVGRLLGALPRTLLTVAVSVMACFYFSIDGGKIRRGLRAYLPRTVGDRLAVLRKKLLRALGCYGRAYLALFALTFGEMLVGLWILRQPYALLIALCVAAVDVLPVLGAGTVLLPWAAIAMLGGDRGLGSGLLVLYGVICIVRQVAEPHLMGSNLGVHPLSALFFTFAGWRLLGLPGMLLGPAAALVIKELGQKEEGT